ncbi:hypothetical protein O4J56_02945 [Nocardiopsis sp. RSe5-2]|uniref:Ribbon-helix-helix protein, CopG family n=1 Tax=Nocardiopsis endophytica TaxID=3018445 RepID=A0ABT4TY44_9ACTN|nr:hypothetical protein [Nocardiopsis endophytica]MDA2809587.1 hypothetical protein [Nocardiopsis endophytica]
MAKRRISISLDPEQAERIRWHAERSGMDISAYLVNAATRQMAETEAAEAEFAGVDALIAEADSDARDQGATVDGDSGPLTVDEQAEVDEAMRLVLGADEPARHNDGEVA